MEDIETLTFEQAFAELEKTISYLESGNLPLEEALATFERGTMLANRCNKDLHKAELKIQKLMESLAGYHLENVGED